MFWTEPTADPRSDEDTSGQPWCDLLHYLLWMLCGVLLSSWSIVPVDTVSVRCISNPQEDLAELQQVNLQQRVLLALCVLTEGGRVQRSVQVVVHGRNVNPESNKASLNSGACRGLQSFYNKDTSSDLLVRFTSFWCSVRTRSFVSGGMKTKSTEASSSKNFLIGGLGEPKSSFVYRKN